MTSFPDSRLQCGYLSKPNGIVHPVSSTDMDMIDLGEDQNPPTEYEFNFTAGVLQHLSIHCVCINTSVIE